MKGLVLAATLAATFHSTVALAWDSYCYRYPDTSRPVAAYADASQEVCAPFAGPNVTRHRWIGPLDEHRQLFEKTREQAGLPAAISETFTLRVYTGPMSVQLGASATGPTQIPAALPVRVMERHLSIGELAQLPDFSYALWDWASGNETCPLGEVGADAEACHDFATHMGPVNANHFLPLAQGFYARYHQVALQRAAACKRMADALSSAGVLERFQSYPRACEVEALALESVGQHYLQDAFSTGHMWERWGSPELVDFEGATPLERRDRAVLVALISGMIHGSRGVLQKLPSWTSYDVNDALCAPHEGVEYARSDGVIVRGLGDDYLDALATVPEHQQRLLSCATSGVLQVYEASGMQHGALGARGPGLSSVDPTGADCFGQRVTNRAMLLGAALQFKFLGQQVEIPLDSRHVGWLVPTVARSSGQVPVEKPLKDRFRFELMRQVSLMRVLAKEKPQGTEIAEGQLGAFLGAKPNGAYRREPISSYDEPALPWPATPEATPGAGARAEYLARTFHRSHADDWCGVMTLEKLQALRDHATAQSTEADAKAAACEACAEFAGRHLADTDGTPSLCSVLSDGTAAAITQPGGGSLEARARTWCGCP